MVEFHIQKNDCDAATTADMIVPTLASSSSQAVGNATIRRRLNWTCARNDTNINASRQGGGISAWSNFIFRRMIATLQRQQI